jgi:hypothetical protein
VVQDIEGNTWERSPRLAPRRRLILLTDLLDNGSGLARTGGLDQPPVHGRVSRPSRSRWPYLAKPDRAMDQPVHARPHVQPILRGAGCAAIRADPQWQPTGTPQPEPRSPPRRRSGPPGRRPASRRPRQSPARLMSSFPGRRGVGRAAAGHGERAGDPGRKASR